ncbi:hypothetical protein IH992_16030 [Candidatus Poribacteria bacterium]|nr:hypothetical protein [Candidatus Poribacteria bacterium]
MIKDIGVGYETIKDIGVGYYVWLASMVLMLWCTLTKNVEQRTAEAAREFDH